MEKKTQNDFFKCEICRTRYTLVAEFLPDGCLKVFPKLTEIPATVAECFEVEANTAVGSCVSCPSCLPNPKAVVFTPVTK